MKLTNGKLLDLFFELSTLERDTELKVSGLVRLKIAKNLNVLQGPATAYENAKTRAMADIVRDNMALPLNSPPNDTATKVRRTDLEMQAEMAEKATELAHVETDDLPLKTILLADLRIEDNPKFSGARLSRLLPIIDLGVEADAA